LAVNHTTQSGGSRATGTGTITGFETHFSRRAAGLDGGVAGEISPDILSPRGDKEEVVVVDELVRLRAALAEEVRVGMGMINHRGILESRDPSECRLVLPDVDCIRSVWWTWVHSICA
jgi:hypothetical protein